MSCTTITKTNGARSILKDKLEEIYGDEEKALDAYSFFDSNSKSFIDDFGDYLSAYGKNVKSFKGRLDENGEPNLFFNETAKKYYYINKDKEEIFYPLSSKGLRGVFMYKQLDKIVSRLANNYFRKSKLNFNNIDLSTSEKLPNLKDYVVDEIKTKIEQLKTQGIKGKMAARLLEESLKYSDEYVEKIDALFKKMSIIRNDNDSEETLDQAYSEDKDPSFNKASFEFDNKNALSSEMKIRLSLLEDDQDLDPVWNEKTFVPFEEVNSTLLKILSNQVALEGEDIFEIFKTLIEKESNKKTYLKSLLEGLSGEDFSVDSKNQFTKAFNLHSNNFLVTEFSDINTEDDEGNSSRKISVDVKQISESGSKKSILLSNWGSNFQKFFLNSENKISEGSKEQLNDIVKELKELSDKKEKTKTVAELTKRVDTYTKILRNIGIEMSKKGMFDFLDGEGMYSLDVNGQIDELNNAINSTLSSLNKIVKKHKSSNKVYRNVFENDKVFKSLSKSESYFMKEGSDASIRTGGKNKWLYSYPSYLSTKILQWKKNPKLLEDILTQSAYGKSSALAKFLLAKDLDQNMIYESSYEEEVKRVSNKRLDALQLGVFNSFQSSEESKDTSELSFSDYFIDNINKVLSSSFVRTTTPADKGTDYQIKTGFFVDAISDVENAGRVIYSNEVKEMFFNYFNSEVNRMKEASAEVDKLKSTPEKLTIFYHYKSKSNIDAKDGNAFQSQYFPDLSFNSETENSLAIEIKEALYDDDGNVKHTADLNNNVEIKTLINRYIDTVLNKGHNDLFSKFIEQEIISYDSNDEASVSKVSTNIFNKYMEDNLNNKERAVNSMVADYHINSLINNIEYSKLFTGDVAYYSDMMDYKKRVPASYTDGLQLRLGEGEENFTIASIDKVFVQTPYYDELVKLLTKDNKPNEDTKPYESINSADGQAWITPKRWKFLMQRLGKWSNDHDSVYAKMISDKNESYTLKELKIAAQPLKGVYFYMNGKVPTFLKYSQAVLTKSLSNNNGLSTMLDQMNKQGVDELITVDGIKVGSPVPTTIHDESGNVLKDITFNTKEISNRGWKLQQDLPVKTTKQTDVGSQLQKNIFNGLIFNSQLSGFVLDDKETNGQTIIDNIVGVVGALTEKGLSEVIKEFKIDKKGKIKNIKGFYNSLINELEKRDGSKNVIDALKKETALYGIPQSIDKITNVFSSVINDRLIKIKTNGGSFIQLSNFGISKQEGDLKGVIWHPDVENGGTTSEPRKIVNENGRTRIIPGSVLISASIISKYIPNWKDYDEKELFVSYQGGDPIINKELQENIIGYRIPNQGLSSNDALKIIGLLPEENGDTIVAYTGITTKTGSDFDIDKMFLMITNYIKNKDTGRLEYVKYDPTLSDKEQSKEALQNRLIELYKSVLTHPEVIKNVMKPLDSKTIERHIKDLFPLDASGPMFHFDPFNDIETRYQFLNGKAGVGMEANAMVDINRIGTLTFNKYSIGWGNTNEKGETILDKEFSVPLSKKDTEEYIDGLNLKNDSERKKVRKEIANMRLAESLTQILSAFVDIAKDPFITRGNWTTSTTNVGNLLLRAGTHPLYAVSFLAQPIIKEFIKYQRSSESITNKQFGEIKDKFRRNIVLENLKKLDNLNEYETETPLSTIYQRFIKTEAHTTKRLIDSKAKEFLYKVIGNKFLKDEKADEVLSLLLKEHNKVFTSSQINVMDNQKYSLKYFKDQIKESTDGDFQLAVLEKFFELQKISKGVKENVDVSRLDTDGMGKNINALFGIFNLKQHILNKEVNGDIGVLNGFESKFEGTQLGKYMRSMRNILKIVRSNPMLFPQADFEVQNMFNEISQDLYDSPAFDKELMDDLEKAYYTYTMSKFGPFDMEKEEISSILTNLPSEVAKFKDSNKGKFLILDELQVKNFSSDKSIFLNNRKKSSEFEEQFTNSWRDLRTENPKLAEDLIKYSFLVSGFKMNAKQFFTYIPNEYMLQEDINSFIRGLDKEDKSDFIDKFYLNNSASYKYIKSVFNDEIETTDKSSGFTLKEPGKSRYYLRLSANTFYKLAGYNFENKAIYTRVDKLGAKFSGLSLPEYGNKFTKKTAKDSNLEKDEESKIDVKYISELQSNVITQRDKFNPNFELVENSIVDEESEDFEETVETPIVDKIFENKEDSDYSIIQGEDGTFDILHAEDGVIGEYAKTIEEAQEVIEKDKLSRLPSKEKEVSNITSMSEITNHSGGAYGADTAWDQVGREFGVTKHMHYRDAGNEKVSQTLKNKKVEATVLSKEEMDVARSEVEKLLGQKYPDTLQGNLQVRNYYQVANSDAVFAIAKLDIIKDRVFGGTNTAVQLGLKLNKPTYVWDINTKKWYLNNGFIFKEIETPILTKDFAGVGTRDIENYSIKDSSGNWVSRKEYVGQKTELLAINAIREVYKKTKDSIENKEVVENSEIESKIKIKEEFESSPVAEKIPAKKGQFAKYNGATYLITKENSNGTFQIYSPKLEGVNSKLSVSKENLEVLKSSAKVISYKGSDYLVTPANTIISTISNKEMKWDAKNGDRINILSLAENGILAPEVKEIAIDTRNIVAPITKKSPFTPANKQQEEAVSSIKEFLKEGDSQEFFILEGKAGTGKTTLIEEAIADSIASGKKVIVGALSHKAKRVLSEKLLKRYSKGEVSSGTIAGLLGMKLDPETQEFTKSYEPEAGLEGIPIESADVVIIDEASMVDEGTIELIMQSKKRSAKVVFLGDRGQLPPIRSINSYLILLRENKPKGWKDAVNDLEELQNERMMGSTKMMKANSIIEKFNFDDLISKAFEGAKKSSLTERVRQGEDSPILPFADYYWDNSEDEKSVIRPVPEKAIKDSLTDKGNLIFAKTFEDAFDSIGQVFKKAVQNKNMDAIKIVTFRNATRSKYNKLIRKEIFGEDANTFEKGDFIMFQNKFDVNERIKFANSDEYVIEDVDKTDVLGYETYQLTVKYDTRDPRRGIINQSFNVLSEKDRDRFNEDVDKRMKKAAAEKSPNARRLMFKAAYDFKDTFANIDYSYAITSHKSQGSGYGISVVDVEDISSVKMNTNKTKSRSNYTAITRAIDTALIITKEADTNKKNIRQALNVEKKSKRENTGNPKDMGCI